MYTLLYIWRKHDVLCEHIHYIIYIIIHTIYIWGRVEGKELRTHPLSSSPIYSPLPYPPYILTPPLPPSPIYSPLDADSNSPTARSSLGSLPPMLRERSFANFLPSPSSIACITLSQCCHRVTMVT